MTCVLEYLYTSYYYLCFVVYIHVNSGGKVLFTEHQKVCMSTSTSGGGGGNNNNHKKNKRSLSPEQANQDKTNRKKLPSSEDSKKLPSISTEEITQNTTATTATSTTVKVEEKNEKSENNKAVVLSPKNKATVSSVSSSPKEPIVSALLYEKEKNEKNEKNNENKETTDAEIEARCDQFKQQLSFAILHEKNNQLTSGIRT